MVSAAGTAVAAGAAAEPMGAGAAPWRSAFFGSNSRLAFAGASENLPAAWLELLAWDCSKVRKESADKTIMSVPWVRGRPSARSIEGEASEGPASELASCGAGSVADDTTQRALWQGEQ